MTIKEEILEDLRRGRSLAEVKKKYRSMSGIYEATREYLNEMDKTLEKKSTRLEAVRNDLDKAEAELERENRDKEETENKIALLNREKRGLSTKVMKETERLERLRADAAELQSKGFSPKILEEIKKTDCMSGHEFLSRIQTAEKYSKFTKQVLSLRAEKAGLEEKIQAHKTQREKLERKIVSQKNQLDEIKTNAIIFNKALSIVRSFFNDGYSARDLEALRAGLKMLAISGKPQLSITRLTKALAQQKTLFALENKLHTRKKALVEVNAALADVKAQLKAISQTKEAIEATRNAGVKAISNSAQEANLSIRSAQAEFETNLKELLGKADTHIQQTMEGLTTEMQEWRKVQQQTGKLEEIIQISQVFLGIFQSTKFLKKVPLSVVVQLLERLRFWVQMNLPDVSIIPSESIYRQDYRFSTWQEYKLTILLEFICESLKKITTQQST